MPLGRAAMAKKLTAKEEGACQDLLTLGKKSAAYRENYSCSKMKATTVNRKAVELFDKPHIRDRVDALKAERSERTAIDADYVLDQAVKIHERVMQEVTPKTFADGTQITDDDGNAMFVFDAKAAVSSLKLIGDHVGIQAFKKVVDVEVGAKKSLAELLKQAADDEK